MCYRIFGWPSTYVIVRELIAIQLSLALKKYSSGQCQPFDIWANSEGVIYGIVVHSLRCPGVDDGVAIGVDNPIGNRVAEHLSAPLNVEDADVKSLQLVRSIVGGEVRAAKGVRIAAGVCKVIVVGFECRNL